MFNFKTKLLATIFICLLFASPASAEYFSDVILTGTEGIWVDSRSYISLQAAVTAVGASDREIVIIGAQAATALTIPANARLKFLRDGSINNTGQLTINTRNISAEDRQIFTGTGDIDFIDGSVVRSSWFSDLVEAFDVTLDDSLTMVISEAGYITLNTTVGNDVTLKWESPDNLLIVYGGKTLSNVKNIEAGNYQIFAGAGDIDFLDGTVLYLNWFRRLRSALTWIESEEVTIIVNEDSLVEYTQASSANESIRILSGGSLTLAAGITLTLNGVGDFAPNSFNISATSTLVLCGFAECENDAFTGLGNLVAGGSLRADSYQIFACTGTLTYTSSTSPNLSWFSDLSSAITAIGAFETGLIIDTDDVMTGNVVVPITLSLKGTKGNTITTTGWTLTVNGPFKAGLYQVFSGAGTVTFSSGSVSEAPPEWWYSGSGTWHTAINTAHDSISKGTVRLLGNKTYSTTGTIIINKHRVNLLGDGQQSTIIDFNPASSIPAVKVALAAGNNVIVQNKIGGFAIDAASDATTTKVAIEIEDVEELILEDVAISNFTSTGVDCIGLQIQGRQTATIKNITIVTDIPISIEDNPNSTIDIDHFHFQDCYLVCTDMTQPVIEIAGGVNLGNVTFDGYQAWAKGSHGLYWNDTTTTGVSYGLTIKNVRWEQSTSAAGYCVYIVHNHGLQSVQFSNIYLGAIAGRGYYLRKTYAVTFVGCFYGATGIGIDLDSTCHSTSFIGCFWQATSTANLSNQRLNFGTNINPNTGALPSTCALDTTTNALAVTAFDSTLRGHTKNTIVDNGEDILFTNVYEGFLMVSISANTHAMFEIRGATGAVAEVIDDSAQFSHTKDNAGTMNVYYVGGSTDYRIQNKTGAEKKYRFLLIGNVSGW